MTRGTLGSRSARRPRSRSIPRPPRSSGYRLGRSTHTGLPSSSGGIPAGTSGANTSPDLPEVTCGCCLETCPTQSKVRYGKSTSRSWPFQQDFLTRLRRSPPQPNDQVRLHTDLTARAESATHGCWMSPGGDPADASRAGSGIAYRSARAAEMRCDRQRIHCFRQIRRSAYEADFIGRGRLAQERRQRLRHGARIQRVGFTSPRRPISAL